MRKTRVRKTHARKTRAHTRKQKIQRGGAVGSVYEIEDALIHCGYGFTKGSGAIFVNTPNCHLTLTSEQLNSEPPRGHITFHNPALGKIWFDWYNLKCMERWININNNPYRDEILWLYKAFICVVARLISIGTLKPIPIPPFPCTLTDL